MPFLTDKSEYIHQVTDSLLLYKNMVSCVHLELLEVIRKSLKKTDPISL